MGPAGCGKSAVGQGLASRLGMTFVDGDDYHPPSNRAKMTRGEPLTDADRWPWLECLADLVAHHEAAGCRVVLACSALKREYRHVLGFPGPKRALVELIVSRDILRHRLSRRQDHFVGPELLDTQLATLEHATDGARVSADAAVETVVQRVLPYLGVDAG